MKYLLESLKDKDPHIRIFTINSIVDNKDKHEALPALIELLFDDIPAVRSRAAWALGKIQDLSSFESLLQALNDIDADVRKNATRSLGELLALDAIPSLVSKLNDENWEVRAEIAVVLEYLGWNPENQEEKTLQLIARGKWDQLVKLSGLNADLLLGFLADSDRETRSKIAWILGELKEENAVQFLFDLFMTDRFQDVKESASVALGRIGGKTALDLILVALHDDDWFIRKNAATALGFMDDPSSIAALEELIKDDNTFVSRSAKEALKRLKG